MRVACLTLLVAGAHGFAGVVSKPSLTVAVAQPKCPARTSPLVAQQGPLGALDNVLDRFASEDTGPLAPAAAVPVAVSNAAGFAAGCSAACFAAPALWAATTGDINSPAVTAFLCGAAAASGFSFAFSAFARAAVEEAKLDALEWRTGESMYEDERDRPSLKSSAYVACGFAVATCFASPAIWAASTAAFNSPIVPSSSLAGFLGASFAFASSASFAFSTIARTADEEAKLDPRWRYRTGAPVAAIPVTVSDSATFAAACTALCFAAPAVSGAFNSYRFPSDSLSAFGCGAAAAVTACFAFSAISRSSVEEAKLDTLEWYSRGEMPYNAAGISSSGFAAGGAAVAACFASPAIWAASTAAFASSTVPSSYLSAFLGASFAFASAGSVAFAAAGSAVEDAEEDELEWLSRFGGGPPRQGSIQQSYNPSYGTNANRQMYNQGPSGGFGQGQMRQGQGYIQGRGPTNQQRQGMMYQNQQQRRGPMSQQRRGSMNRQMGPQNGRYTGVVVPTNDMRLAEPRDADWREASRGQSYRRR